MQISGVSGVKFTGNPPVALLEDRAKSIEQKAQAIEDGDFSDAFDISPEQVVNVVDAKLQKSEKGRKVINFLATVVGFAAAVYSFKKAAPHIRSAIGQFTTAVGKKIGTQANGKEGKAAEGIKEFATELAQNGEKLGKKGDGTGLRKFIGKFTKKPDSVMNVLGKVGVESGADVADLGIATTAAVLAGREAGDVVDEKQKDATLAGVIKDLATLGLSNPGA